MVKKFLNIFKRDKSVFSNEELKCQVQNGKRLQRIIIAGLIIAEIMGVFPLLEQSCKFSVENFSNEDIGWIFPLAVYGIIIIIDFVIDAVIYVKFMSNIEEMENQLKSNLATEHKAEILFCLKGQEYSKVKFQEVLINELCRMLLKDSKFKIETTDKVTRISLPDSDVKPLEITNENILEYFN